MMVKIMKIFIAKKRIKLPRYKLYYIILSLSIILIILLNITLNIFLKNNEEPFLDIFLGNSFGNITTHNINNMHDFLFYRNIWGLNIKKDTQATNINPNIKDIIITPESTKIVYIYNTFQTSKYQANHLSSYSITPVITQASLILQEYLTNLNIGSIVETKKIAEVLKEEDIAYTNSYKASRILMERAQEQNPTLKYFFDITLSNSEEEVTTTQIDELRYAKILFVVGTDNPDYAKNQDMAKKLNAILEKLNPSLSRGISLRGGTGYQGIYNQDYSEYTLLIEVGGTYNTIDEVNRSLKVLAEVISTYIKEDLANEEE